MNEENEISDEMLDHLDVLIDLEVVEAESDWEIISGPEGDGHE